MSSYSRKNLTPEQRDYNNWPDIDVTQLSVTGQRKFKRRKLAVTRYLDGDSLRRIEEDTGFRRDQVQGFLEKCLKINIDDGRIWGFRGLIPGIRQEAYERTKPVPFLPPEQKAGYAGALSQFFREHPKIHDFLVALIKNKSLKGQIPERCMRITDLHDAFIRECKKEGLTAADYPLNTKERSRRSLATFVDKLYLSDPKGMLEANKGHYEAAQWGSTSSAEMTPAYRPFERVEFDAHRIDAKWTIEFVHPWGGLVVAELNWIWLLELLDVFSRATLGYHLVAKPKPNAGDVLACIEHALTPWRPLQLTIPDLKYPDGAGFPSGMIAKCERVLWDETRFDNAWENLAFEVTDSLMEVVGCDVNAGEVGVPNRRPFVERFFRTLEEHSFHRLRNTTGSNPNDPHRQDPEKNARKYHMTYQDLVQILDVELATLNAQRGHSGIGGRSPLEVLEYYCANENNLIRSLPPENIDELEWLGERKGATIQGNVKKGRRPYVQYLYAHYDNLMLKDSPGLIGRKVTLLVKPFADITRLKIFLDDGTDLGCVEPNDSWGIMPHDLYQRKLAIKLIREGKIPPASQANPITAAKEYFASKASQSKKDATHYLNLTQSPIPPQGWSDKVMMEDSQNTKPERNKKKKYSGKPVFWSD